MARISLSALFVLASVPLWAEDGRIPVIVELFTSEGCSSCPRADLLLARLDHTQPVPNARVIALEEHVDYWNYLGWKDPFSSALYRGRQNDYAHAFQTEDVYTPQMVVNGQAQFIGDDSPKASEEIARAAKDPGFSVSLQPAWTAAQSEIVEVTVSLRSLRRKQPHANVYLAVTEEGLQTNVGGGENSGRLLRHGPVVRSFGLIGKWDAKGSDAVTLKPTLKLPPEWKRENLRAVVFVQERDTHRITGAGFTSFTR